LKMKTCFPKLATFLWLSTLLPGKAVGAKQRM